MPSSSSSDDSREMSRSVEVVARGDFLDGVALLREDLRERREGGGGGEQVRRRLKRMKDKLASWVRHSVVEVRN